VYKPSHPTVAGGHGQQELSPKTLDTLRTGVWKQDLLEFGEDFLVGDE
jgi:hypothetical protein